MNYLVPVFFIFSFFFSSLAIAKNCRNCQECRDRENRLVISSQFLRVDYEQYIDDGFDPYYLIVLSDGSRWTIYIEEGISLIEGIVVEKRVLNPTHFFNPDGYRYLLVFYRDHEIHRLYRYDEG